MTIDIINVDFEGMQELRKVINKKIIRIDYKIQEPTFLDTLFWRPGRWTVALVFEDDLNANRNKIT